MRLLLIEDDAMIGEALRSALRRRGETVDWVRDGKAADTALMAERFDAVLLDLGLPQRDGLSVLKGLRSRGDDVPVLIVTARDAVADRVAGLDAGADDYLVKPFDIDELAARLRAMLRRKAGRSTPLMEHAGVVLDPATRLARKDGQPLELPAREFTLLAALMERPGVVLSRPQLEERLYGWGEEVESNAVEVCLHRLRRKLGADFIQNIRGVGYRLRSGS